MIAEARDVTIGLVTHYAFCPRRAWLEAAGEQTDTFQMAVGTASHQEVDDPSRGQARVFRAIDVTHPDWGYHGRCDTVEEYDDGSLGVVEFKATPVRRRAEVTEPMRIQLALQAAGLEAAGYRVRDHSVYFTEHRRRVTVALAEADFALARQMVARTRTVVESQTAPEPLEDHPRCSRCSHVLVCLPDERELAPVRRRIVVADPDSQVLHLATPGSRASVRAGRLLVRKGDDDLATIPLERVQGLVVHGNVDLSGALIRELLWRQLSIVWCTNGGRVVGWASSTDSPNGAARARQHGGVDGELALGLAREFVGAKITNQATFLRRNGRPGPTLGQLRRLSRLARESASVSELYGVEGEAASLYFDRFSSMLRVAGISFQERSRRPATDVVSAALNYAYSLLLAECIRGLRACGLDPHIGFLHSSTRNKPALALDLMEEFRAPVADSVVIRAFNNGEIDQGDFRDRFGQVSLTENGRRSLIAAHERRIATEMTHPTFGYRVSWRRAIEVQARLLLGVLDGTQPTYVGIRTR